VTTPLRAVRLFHRTTAGRARAILASGFKDGVGTYLTDQEWRGVWLSNVPLDEGAGGDTLLLEVRIARPWVARYEWKERGSTHREFLVPARVLNARASVRLQDEEALPARYSVSNRPYRRLDPVGGRPRGGASPTTLGPTRRRGPREVGKSRQSRLGSARGPTF
jgi:hypothetical protein